MLFVPKSKAKTVMPINNVPLDRQNYAYQCQAIDWPPTSVDHMANQTKFVPSPAQPAKSHGRFLAPTD
jgi:hypothetical protein